MQNKWRRERNISLGRGRSSSGRGAGGLKDPERRGKERAAVLPFTPAVLIQNMCLGCLNVWRPEVTRHTQHEPSKVRQEQHEDAREGRVFTGKDNARKWRHMHRGGMREDWKLKG